MTPRLKVFLDTSVIFAAVLSPEGGSRLLLQLGEIGLLELVVGPGILQELEGVVRRKAPDTLAGLAAVLEAARITMSQAPGQAETEYAKTLVDHPPDRQVLAEALDATPDWFVTLDRKHFLENAALQALPFRIGTPGDVIEVFKHSSS